jgi:uncharacterized protein (TIGR02145 family)
MKNILTLFLICCSFISNAQRTMFEVNNDYVAPNLPVISTTSISSIGNTSAISGGNITDDGGSYIISRGVVWSTSTLPTIALSTKTVNGAGAGNFASSITGLSQSTTYYVRAYATNSTGTSYGTQISFTTTEPIYTVTTSTGRIWMDRNLGATRVPTSQIDAQGYGDLYQWGREKDGHQIRTSSTYGIQSTSDIAGNALFITNISYTIYSDWRKTKNDNLWQGVNGINNPCPAGFRIPTQAEWEAEIQTWSGKNATGAFASPLKLPPTGNRQYNGVISTDNVSAYYWTSTVSQTQVFSMNFTSSGAYTTNAYPRVNGYACRCIKN